MRRAQERHGSKRGFLVAHPEKLHDLLLDADEANMRRNLESMLSLIGCLCDARGIRRRFIFGDRWHTLEMPTIFLWGERDAFGTPEEGEAIGAGSGNLRVVRIPDAGHLPWLDDPARAVDEMGQFFRDR